MSRIGKLPVAIPAGVTVDISDDNLVTIKGSKGSLSRQIDKDMKLSLEDGSLTIERPNDQRHSRAMHGTLRAIINNMVEGVSKGYKKELQLVGVGYKATVSGQFLDLNLGYSHNIYMQIPKEVTASAETKKGKDPIVTLESIDKELIGQVAAKIRSLRKIEPYKGKGVRFVGEVIRRKAGKTASK